LPVIVRFEDVSEMLGTSTSQNPLLICIDEVSKLVDAKSIAWNNVVKKEFWQGIYSLIRATRNWIRVVMTGFTDSPERDITLSDVACAGTLSL
jgi:hypothetical protein